MRSTSQDSVSEGLEDTKLKNSLPPLRKKLSGKSKSKDLEVSKPQSEESASLLSVEVESSGTTSSSSSSVETVGVSRSVAGRAPVLINVQSAVESGEGDESGGSSEGVGVGDGGKVTSGPSEVRPLSAGGSVISNGDSSVSDLGGGSLTRLADPPKGTLGVRVGSGIPVAVGEGMLRVEGAEGSDSVSIVSVTELSGDAESVEEYLENDFSEEDTMFEETLNTQSGAHVEGNVAKVSGPA